jgi:S1-C subfamily serine protease
MTKFYKESYERGIKVRRYVFISFGALVVVAAILLVVQGGTINREIMPEQADSAFVETKPGAPAQPVPEAEKPADPGTTDPAAGKETDKAEESEAEDIDWAGGLYSKTLDRLKEATVFIKVTYSYGRKSSGSGFLFLTDYSDGYVVTNAHVILEGDKPAANIQVVFDSGHPAEKAYKAGVLAFDKDRDLALLKISSEDFPIPLSEMDTATVRETMPVYIFGFPFGQGLAIDGQGNPEVTVSSGSISSIRHDKYGNVSYVQVTGDINPGNSGGPIVDKKGKIVGIAVAKVKGTQIGLAIPTKSLEGFFQGRVSKSSVSEESNADGDAKISITLQTIDPLKKIKNIGVVLVSKEDVKLPFPMNEDGTPQRIGKSMKVYKKCTWDKTSARIRFVLKGKPGEIKNYYFQVGFSDETGVVRFLEPTPFELTFREERMASSGRPGSRGQPSARPGKRGKKDKAPPLASVPKVSQTRSIKTPEIITNCVPAGGGGYLVVFFKKLRKLGVFSLAKRKFSSYISVPSSEILYTAGRNYIVAVDPGNGLIMRYSLFDGKRELTQRVPVTGIVQRIAMGSNTDGPLLVRWAVGSSALDRAVYDLVDITSMRKTTNQSIRPRNGSYRDNVHLRPSADGSVVGIWATSHSPTGLGCLIFYGNSVERKYEHNSVGHVVPGPKGQYLYTSSGYYSNSLKSLSEDLRKSRQPLIPGLEGPYFIGLSAADTKRSSYYDREYDMINVYLTGNSTPLFSYKIDTAVTGKISRRRGDNRGSDFSLDRRIYFLPSSGLLVIIPDVADKIVLSPLDVMDSLKKSGIDYLFVSSQPRTMADRGSQYIYQIKVMSKSGGVRYNLESAPDGMTISSRGRISWFTDDTTASPVSVIVLVSDRSGQEIFHTFNINLR